MKMRKKIVAARDLPAGHSVSPADLALKSPGDGLPPYELDRVVGRTLKKPMVRDETLTFEHLDELIPQFEEALSTEIRVTSNER